MIITPLYQKQGLVYVSNVKVMDLVYSKISEHNLTFNKKYLVKENAYGDILITNDEGIEDWYSCEWFSLTEIIQ